MGAFAGMTATVDEILDNQDRRVGNVLSVLDVTVPQGRSLSYILSNTWVMKDSKNNLSNCTIDQELRFQAGLLAVWFCRKVKGPLP